jgi:hypothetical protein
VSPEVPVKLERDELGRIAYLRSPWTPKDAEAIRRSGVRRLHISLREDDMPFVRELEGIEEVQIVALGVKSDGVLAGLPDLRVLGLQNYCDDPIDFAAFKRLERLLFYWRRMGETAFEAVTLKSLAIHYYKESDLSPLRRLERLEGLRIENSRRLRTLDGVAALGALKVLSLRDDQGLADIGALATMSHSLQELQLQLCHKVNDITSIGRHHDLKRLSLIDCGHIPSLAPLAELAQLEEFYFYGTTYIEDGDMTPLLGMPSLRRVGFASRRHNSHSVADIERLRHLKESSPPLPHWRW